MRAARAGLAKVVDIAHLSHDGEDDVVGNLRGRSTGRPGGDAENQGEEEKPSGCPPVASHAGGRARSEGVQASKLCGSSFASRPRWSARTGARAGPAHPRSGIASDAAASKVFGLSRVRGA